MVQSSTAPGALPKPMATASYSSSGGHYIYLLLQPDRFCTTDVRACALIVPISAPTSRMHRFPPNADEGCTT
jgi:hypothetical protein